MKNVNYKPPRGELKSLMATSRNNFLRRSAVRLGKMSLLLNVSLCWDGWDAERLHLLPISHYATSAPALMSRV